MNPSFSKKFVGDITNLYQNIQEAPLRDEPLWDMEGDPKPTPTPVVKPSSVGAVTPTQATAAASDLRNTGNVSQTNTAAARPNTGVTPLKPVGTQPTATQATAAAKPMDPFAAGGGAAKMAKTGMTRDQVIALGNKNLTARPAAQTTTTASTPAPTTPAPTASRNPLLDRMRAMDNKPEDLAALRKASAQATMAGPSREAQALMSDRTKRMLGADKLRAGIAGQERVETMKANLGKPVAATTPAASSTPIAKPAPTTTATPPTARPLPAFGTFGTTMGPGPTFRGGPVTPPIENRAAIRPTDWSKIKSSVKEGVDVFDLVKNYLIREGYADTEEAAFAIMTNMSEEWKQSIIRDTF